METDKGIAIITGASQGIGAVVAKGLANDGLQVVLIARNEENLTKYVMKLCYWESTYSPQLYYL